MFSDFYIAFTIAHMVWVYTAL